MKLFGGSGRRKSTDSTSSRHFSEIEIDSTQGEQIAGPNPVPGERPKKKKLRNTLIITFSILAVLAVAITIWWTQNVVPPDHGDVLKASPSPNVSGSDIDASPSPSDPENTTGHKDGVYTFLIIGMDQGNGNTDTIITGTFDTVELSFNAVSIPRDTLVNVSWPTKKVNSIYGQTDIDGLIEGVQNLLGYTVDCYAIIDLEAFVKIVDTIGGVYYDVPINMDYDDPTQNLHIHLSKGYQKLDGTQALGVVRYRLGNNGTGYSNGDIGRIETQQDFLMSVAKQMLTLGNIPNLTKLSNIAAEYVDMNLTAGNIIWFATQFLKLDSENVTFHTLPGDYLCSIKGLSYVSIYLDEWLEMINTYLNPFYEEITADNLNILTKDANGNLFATTGTIAGGINSFYDATKSSTSTGSSNGGSSSGGDEIVTDDSTGADGGEDNSDINIDVQEVPDVPNENE